MRHVSLLVLSLAILTGCAFSGDDADLLDSSEPSAVTEQPAADGVNVTLASGQHKPAYLAIDASYVYWTNAVDAGTVRRVPKGGGAVTSLATGQAVPAGIGVD